METWQIVLICVAAAVLITVLCAAFKPIRAIFVDLGITVVYLIVLPFRLLYWLALDIRAFGIYLFCTRRHEQERKANAPSKLEAKKATAGKRK